MTADIDSDRTSANSRHMRIVSESSETLHLLNFESATVPLTNTQPLFSSRGLDYPVKYGCVASAFFGTVPLDQCVVYHLLEPRRFLEVLFVISQIDAQLLAPINQITRVNHRSSLL
jgi:hypothetical protein